jgi:hypothetical protein
MTPFEEFASPADLRADCQAVNARLAAAARRAVAPAPSIRFEDYPREVAKRDIEISEAAQRLANALHLHLD